MPARGFDRGSCVVFESDQPQPIVELPPLPRQGEQEMLDWLKEQNIRGEVEDLFKKELGDNMQHESVQRLIDGVVDLIRKREASLC